jgi:penicillin-binding protein 1A
MAKKRKFSRLVLAAAILAGLIMGLTLGLFIAVGQGLPQVQALEDWEPGAATRIMSADGRVLAEFFLEKRLPLQLSEIPDQLKQAVISVEDRRFRQHPGLDVIRTFGALLKDIRARRLAQGGSTITQQLARNLFLTPEKTLRRKLKELFLALQIERQYTKDEILGFYLNQIYFGAGAYGVGAPK